jgi:hypothetical protein
VAARKGRGGKTAQGTSGRGWREQAARPVVAAGELTGKDRKKIAGHCVSLEEEDDKEEEKEMGWSKLHARMCGAWSGTTGLGYRRPRRPLALPASQARPVGRGPSA